MWIRPVHVRQLKKLAEWWRRLQTASQTTMPPVQPPARVDAETFHKELMGSHEALLVSTRGLGGAAECVIKLSERLGDHPKPYLCEWVATAVAAELGVHVPDPFAVRISRAFARALPDGPLRRDALASTDVAFGCRFMSGYSQWAPVVGVHPEQRDAASELFAFDVLAHNFDRKDTNPNLMVRREDLLAIDHDLAFEFVYPPGRPDPGTNPRRDVVDTHAFRQPLKGKLSGLAEFRQKVGQLTDSWLRSLEVATPAEWKAGQGQAVLDSILAVLALRRDHLEEWLRQVEVWME